VETDTKTERVKMPLRYFGDPILKEVCQPIEAFDETVAELEKELVSVFLEKKAMGLAANQIGINKQMCIVARVKPVKDSYEVVGYATLTNPTIISEDGIKIRDYEGCLSFPDLYITVQRPTKLTVEFNDISGNRVQTEFTEFEARIAYHEVDHLNGITMLERISTMERIKVGNMVRQLRKRIEQLKTN
jgi:peptide deformylase